MVTGRNVEASNLGARKAVQLFERFGHGEAGGDGADERDAMQKCLHARIAMDRLLAEAELLARGAKGFREGSGLMT